MKQVPFSLARESRVRRDRSNRCINILFQKVNGAIRSHGGEKVLKMTSIVNMKKLDGSDVKLTSFFLFFQKRKMCGK